MVLVDAFRPKKFKGDPTLFVIERTSSTDQVLPGPFARVKALKADSRERPGSLSLSEARPAAHGLSSSARNLRRRETEK